MVDGSAGNYARKGTVEDWCREVGARAAGNSDFDGDKTVAARLFFHPFLKSESKPLQKFGFGLSVAA
jgi:hypothetical protein